MSPAPRKDADETPIVPTSHRYVVVEGPIGVGKTSLARRLAKSFGSELVLEQGDENPFLERFYKNPRAAAFQTQLYFLFQRSRQLQDLWQADRFERGYHDVSIAGESPMMLSNLIFSCLRFR